MAELEHLITSNIHDGIIKAFEHSEQSENHRDAKAHQREFFLLKFNKAEYGSNEGSRPLFDNSWSFQHNARCADRLSVILTLDQDNWRNHVMRLYLRVLVQMSGSSRSGPSGVVHFLLPSICILLKRRTRLKTGWRHEHLIKSQIDQQQNEQWLRQWMLGREFHKATNTFTFTCFIFVVFFIYVLVFCWEQALFFMNAAITFTQIHAFIPWSCSAITIWSAVHGALEIRALLKGTTEVVMREG